MSVKKYLTLNGLTYFLSKIKSTMADELDGKSDVGHTHTKSDITDLPTLATVATSGDYDDLTNKPTIPTVNNATLTIQKNGADVQTFTANASSNVTCNITVPTKTSDLTNDSNFVDTSNSAVSSGITSAKVTSYDSHVADTDIHVTTADKNKWNNGVSQSYVFRYSSTALVASSTNSNTLLDNTDNLKVGDKVIDSSGVLFSITAIDTANSTFTVGTALIDLALDGNVVHTSGSETVNGNKTWASQQIWNDNCQRRINSTFEKGETPSSNYGRNDYYTVKNGTSSYANALGVIGCVITTGNKVSAYLHAIKNQAGVSTRTTFEVSYDTNTDQKEVSTNADFLPTSSGQGFGNSTNKWATINGLTPSALGMPDLSNGIDISSYITVVANANKESLYTPPANGWVSVRLSRTSGASGVLLIQGNMASSGKNIEVESGATTADAMLPVKGGVQVSINSALADGVVSAYFYPCQGNV